MNSEQKKVVVVDGDDASPEVMIPAVALLESMQLPITFERSSAKRRSMQPALDFLKKLNRPLMIPIVPSSVPPAARIPRRYFICAGASKPTQTSGLANGLRATTRRLLTRRALISPSFAKTLKTCISVWKAISKICQV